MIGTIIATIFNAVLGASENKKINRIKAENDVKSKIEAVDAKIEQEKANRAIEETISEWEKSQERIKAKYAKK